MEAATDSTIFSLTICVQFSTAVKDRDSQLCRVRRSLHSQLWLWAVAMVSWHRNLGVYGKTSNGRVCEENRLVAT